MTLNSVNFTFIKNISVTLGGALLFAGQVIEPQIAIWVVSLGASLLWVTLGDDASVLKIVVNIFLALFWGIFGSQIAFAIFPIMPRLAECFFLSLFGVPASYYFIRNLKDTNFFDLVTTILDKIIPWRGFKK